MAGVDAPYPKGAGDSSTLTLLDSTFESDGLSVRGGEVSPCIKGADEVEGVAAKYAANPVG